MIELVVKNGSKEEQILDFVGGFFKVQFRKVEKAKIFTKLPTLIIDENDHVAGLALILRTGFYKKTSTRPKEALGRFWDFFLV